MGFRGKYDGPDLYTFFLFPVVDFCTGDINFSGQANWGIWGFGVWVDTKSPKIHSGWPVCEVVLKITKKKIIQF